MPNGLVLEQVVEVRVPKPGRTGNIEFGSGYLISPSLVVTAGHVINGARSADVRFSVRRPDQPLAVPADVAWTGESCDIALLRLRWPAGGPPWEVTAAALGDVPRSRSEISFEAVGFPNRKVRERPDKPSLLDSDHVGGMILGERNLKSGVLDLHLTRDPAGQRDPWKGFSGAAVFAHGFLVGVVVEAERVTPGLIAQRIAIPAGACGALNRSYTEPDESIARFRQLLAEDGHDLRVSPARRRPDYAQTIDELRPKGGLLDRDAELAELRAFVRPGVTGDFFRPYAEWVADAWAGKTALAAQFASDPPPGADIVAFFASRVRVQQTTQFWKPVCDQLAALVNEGPRLQADEDAFRALWARAGEEAERNGRTLVLLIDGLDENDQPPPIAGVIPVDGDQTRRVVVFRREQPQPPLPDGHPLCDPRTCIRMTLAKSAHAQDRKRDAVDALRAFLVGRQADALGVLAAAGPISARDIAAVLCLEDPSLPGSRLFSAREISPLMRRAVSRGLVWQLAEPADRFAFQHDTLPQITADELAVDDVITVHQDAIKRWAAGYAERGWPEGTPSYLLVGYPEFLAGLADAAGLAALASPARAARLRASTGDDAATVDELALAIGQLAKAGSADLPTACGLAFRREQLLDALTRYPVSLIEAHAALGHWLRAEHIAAHQAWPPARVGGLTVVAAAAADAGDARRADLLFAAALRALTAIDDWNQRYNQRQSLASAAAGKARLVDPRIVSAEFGDPSEGASTLLAFAAAYAAAGLIDYAEQFMDEACGPAGPLARSADAADAVAAAAANARQSADYGQPGNTFSGFAERIATTQTHLNIVELTATVAGIVVRAAARAGRLDTAVRVAAVLPEKPGLLALIGEACRTAADTVRESQLTELFGAARSAADRLPDPVQRAAALTIIAGAATRQLADDIAVAARMAGAAIVDPAMQAQVRDVVAAAAGAGRPVPDLIAAAREAIAGVPDRALRAPALTIIALAAAAAGQPADDLFSTAGAAAGDIPDLSQQALTMGTVALAAAVAAQLAACRSATADMSNPAQLTMLAGIRQAVPGDLSLAWLAFDQQMDADSRAATLRSHVGAIATSQLTLVRSIVAAIPDPAQRADVFGALAWAASAPPAYGLSAAARKAASNVPDPRQRAWTLGTLAQGIAASGQIAVAALITIGLVDPGQRAWTYAAIAQAAAAAGQPAAGFITTARDIGVTITDRDPRAWALGATAQAAAMTGQVDAGRSVAAELSDPAQRAWAFGLIARAAGAAGQPADDLITGARDAAQTIGHPAQRAWALAQAARDAAAISQSGLATQLVADAEQAALAEDPILRSGLLAAMARAAIAQPERATLLFERACQAAQVPDPVQQAMALAEIARYVPEQPGWTQYLAQRAQNAAGLADLMQRSLVLAALAQAATRSGDDVFARRLADGIPNPAQQLWALLTLARSAAMRGNHSGAEALCEVAGQAARLSGTAAPPWAQAAIANTTAFCGNLRGSRAAAAGLDCVRALIGAQSVQGFAADSAEEAAVVEAARRNDLLPICRPFARSVSDPIRRAYLLAAIAEAELAEGKTDDATATLALMPPRAALADRSARGRLLAVAVTVTAARDAQSARAELTVGLADCFSPELIPVIAELDGQAIERVAEELGVR
jgi:hypothetical protein